ncbi:amidohydrolase family protein, partial [Mycobacterium interjectum]
GPDRVAPGVRRDRRRRRADGGFRLGAVPIDVASGVARVRGTSTIAGSTATMDQIFRTVVAHAGLEAAARMTAATPARALGLQRIGGLRAGFEANLVVLDGALAVRAVMVRGDWRHI